MLLSGVKRCFHVQQTFLAQVEKSVLAKLRKKTGYTISNCKKALELNESDIQKATSWLHEQAQNEGWAKAEKLQGRQTAQGLIGILMQHKTAAMVEVNCETDFVSRNREFLNLVSSIAAICHTHAKNTCTNNAGNIAKLHLDNKQLMALPWEENSGKTLADLVAMKIGQVGENMALHRAICYRVADHLELGCYAHPIGDSTLQSGNFFHGKYGAILAFEKSAAKDTVGTNLTAEQCGRQLSQHIIGMNPQSIGNIADVVEKVEEPLAKDDDDESHLVREVDDESRLVHQDFLVDPLVTVADFLQQYGITVMDFVRYECGETHADKD